MLVLVTALGWIYWQNFIYKAPIEKTTDVVVVDKNPQSQQDNNSNININYLLVRELGIEIPQASANQISYMMSASNPRRATFVSSEQKALGGSCGTFASARYHILLAPIGYKSNDPVEQAQLENAYKVEMVDDAYYIIGDMSGGDCTGKLQEGQSMSQEEIAANRNLLEELKQLRVAKDLGR
jgi:hypothetical protein